MRNVDLAVSVAHAGVVDPETSHSTIEMREAILSFVLPLFRLNNVKIQNRRNHLQNSAFRTRSKNQRSQYPFKNFPLKRL
jgi:hypothetical protein